MSDDKNPVLEALDATDGPLMLFLRDDDAGWDDARLSALLDVTQRAQVPIDLAAIPMAVGESMAREINARIDAAPDRIGVHQHGFSHANHEAQGRSCEFGASRDITMQRHDLLQGRVRLRRLFGHRFQAIFTPPWNRCAASTPALLAELGYAALSRDRGAPAQGALAELAVDLDWTREFRRAGVQAVNSRLARLIAERSSSHRPLGLMTHHAAMTVDELALFDAWLRGLADHPAVRWHSMRSLLNAPASSSANQAQLP